MTAAVSAVLVGIGILVSFFVRDESLENPFFVAVIFAPGLSGLAGSYFSRHPIRFVASYMVFVASVAPTIFGWIIFLYLPSLMLLTIVGVMVIGHPIYRQIKRSFQKAT